MTGIAQQTRGLRRADIEIVVEAPNPLTPTTHRQSSIIYLMRTLAGVSGGRWAAVAGRARANDQIGIMGIGGRNGHLRAFGNGEAHHRAIVLASDPGQLGEARRPSRRHRHRLVSRGLPEVIDPETVWGWVVSRSSSESAAAPNDMGISVCIGIGVRATGRPAIGKPAPYPSKAPRCENRSQVPPAAEPPRHRAGGRGCDHAHAEAL